MQRSRQPRRTNHRRSPARLQEAEVADALRAFQKSRSLPETGRVDDDTLYALTDPSEWKGRTPLPSDLNDRSDSRRAGISYDLSRVLKHYAITLQPNNFLAPVLTPSTPDAPITVVDNDPNIGTTYTSYLQDSWRMSDLWEADYGMRPRKR